LNLSREVGQALGLLGTCLLPTGLDPVVPRGPQPGGQEEQHSLEGAQGARKPGAQTQFRSGSDSLSRRRNTSEHSSHFATARGVFKPRPDSICPGTRLQKECRGLEGRKSSGRQGTRFLCPCGFIQSQKGQLLDHRLCLALGKDWAPESPTLLPSRALILLFLQHLLPPSLSWSPPSARQKQPRSRAPTSGWAFVPLPECNRAREAGELTLEAICPGGQPSQCAQPQGSQGTPRPVPILRAGYMTRFWSKECLKGLQESSFLKPRTWCGKTCCSELWQPF
jgi:hypothetical protein